MSIRRRDGHLGFFFSFDSCRRGSKKSKQERGRRFLGSWQPFAGATHFGVPLFLTTTATCSPPPRQLLKRAGKLLGNCREAVEVCRVSTKTTKQNHNIQRRGVGFARNVCFSRMFWYHAGRYLLPVSVGMFWGLDLDLRPGAPSCRLQATN